jgi:hypothetical protein
VLNLVVRKVPQGLRGFNNKLVSVHVYVRVWSPLNCLRMGPTGGFYEHCDDASRSKQNDLRNYRTFKRFCSLSLLAIWLYLMVIKRV